MVLKSKFLFCRNCEQVCCDEDFCNTGNISDITPANVSVDLQPTTPVPPIPPDITFTSVPPSLPGPPRTETNFLTTSTTAVFSTTAINSFVGMIS